METLIILSANYLYLLVLALAGVVFLRVDTPTKWKMAKLALFVFPLCFVIALIAGSLVSSPRPFVVDGLPPLIQAASDNGFPSDHTLLAMAVAAVIFAYHRKAGILLLLLAAWVGIARVVAHVHHPIDVIGSTLIVLTTTFLCYRFLVNRIPFPRPPENLQGG